MKKRDACKLETYKRIIPYLFLFLGMFFLHINMNLGYSDDSHFKAVLSEKNIFEHMLNLYFNVNGKIFTDLMPAIFTYIPNIWFKLLNSLFLVVIAFSISNVFLDATYVGDRIACILVLFFPMKLLTSAGYVATSTNYVWTTTAFLVILLGIKWSENKKISAPFYIIWTLALLYAGNQEQICAISIMVFVGMLIRNKIFKQKLNGILIYGLIIECISLIFVMTAPGHLKRVDGYSIFRIPNYPQLNLVDKVYLGITSTIAHYLSFDNILFVVLSILLVYIVWKKKNAWSGKLYATVPVLSILWIEILDRFDIFPNMKQVFCYQFEWGYGQKTFAMVDVSNYDQFESYFPICLCIVLIISILVCFYLIFGHTVHFYLCLFLMAAGFATRAVMAFSPTLFGSGTRTHIFLYFCLISICSIIAYEYLKKRDVFVWIVISSGAIISFVSSYMGIIQ